MEELKSQFQQSKELVVGSNLWLIKSCILLEHRRVHPLKTFFNLLRGV